MASIEDQVAEAFVCAKCGRQGGHVERLAMTGTGLSRMFEVQKYRYAFVSCQNCGYTEAYNLRILQRADNLGILLEILFGD